MDYQLKGKIALVTGSTLGIGFAIAQGLAHEGAAVIVNGRDKLRVAEAKKRIEAYMPSAKVQTMAVDLGTAEGCAALIAEYPYVDILVNNLGIFEIKSFEQITDADWLRFFETNVMSGVRLSRHYLPLMMKKNWGRIVFISSESGLNTPVEMIHYGMTKSAQLALARGLAAVAAGTSVTVNAVLPGPTGTEGVGTFLQSMAEQQSITMEQVEKNFFAQGRPTSLIKRFASPAEVANLVVYVCSPLSSATTGASLRVEGGVVNSIA
jgi:NAD(P)-dependent dehydrogenase (short-subunit alcohol dehydrogenase family)